MSYNKPVNIIPLNDEERIRQLHQYNITDNALAHDFDTILLLITDIFQKGQAFINFVDAEYVFSTANKTDGTNKIARVESLCSLAILEDSPTLFLDTKLVPDFLHAPYLSANKEIRFYVAVPLKNAEGFNIGTIGVMDYLPNQDVSDHQLNTLKLLAALVMEKLEARLSNILLTQTNILNLRRLVHDLKNPITTISLYAQLLGNKEMTADKVFVMANRIEKSSVDIQNNLNNLLTETQSR